MARFVARRKTSLDGMKTDQMPPMISHAMVALCVWKCQLPHFQPCLKQIDPAANHSIFIIAAKLFAAALFFASMPALISFILTLFLLAHHGSAQRREHAAELRAVKGQVLFGEFYGLSNGFFYSFLYTCCIPPTSSLRKVSQSEECGRFYVCVV